MPGSESGERLGGVVLARSEPQPGVDTSNGRGSETIGRQATEIKTDPCGWRAVDDIAVLEISGVEHKYVAEISENRLEPS